MKKLYYISLFILAITLCSCGKDELKDVVPAQTGTVTDNEGNVYEWVQIGDLQWTTTNAKNGPKMTEIIYWDDWGWTNAFDPDEVDDMNNNYMPVYGNLMKWDDAVESAPAGWRLPTDEDWQKLETSLGMTETNALGIRGENGVGYKLQQADAGSRLGLILGGGINKKIAYMWIIFSLDNWHEFGYYWTATEGPDVNGNTKTAYYRKIFENNGGVDRRYGKREEKYMSVRWVRDVK